MGLILFDWKNPINSKMTLNTWFSMLPLFDGYLTESKSFQQLEGLTYLTANPKTTTKFFKTLDQKALAYLMVI